MKASRDSEVAVSKNKIPVFVLFFTTVVPKLGITERGQEMKEYVPLLVLSAVPFASWACTRMQIYRDSCSRCAVC